MKKRKICVVVTARPSYSRVKSALTAIKQHPKLELQLVIAGSALLGRYGNAVDFIEKDGFEIAEKVFMVLEGENVTSMAKTTGLGIMELANVIFKLQPDAVVTIADRFETIATSIAAAYQNIPLVHLQGGEVTGNIDEKVRHANTKLADIHLVASEDAKKRVLKMGEDPTKVFNTGCPSIDLAKEIKETSSLDFDPIKKMREWILESGIATEKEIDGVLNNDPNNQFVPGVFVQDEFGVSENGSVWISENQLRIRVLPFIANELVLVLSKKDIYLHKKILNYLDYEYFWW